MEKSNGLYDNQKLIYTKHAIDRMIERKIMNDDIRAALKTAQLVNDEDYVCANGCCLIVGISVNGKPIHIVIKVKKKVFIVVTTYFPDAKLWESNFKTRRKR